MNNVGGFGFKGVEYNDAGDDGDSPTAGVCTAVSPEEKWTIIAALPSSSASEYSLSCRVLIR